MNLKKENLIRENMFSPKKIILNANITKLNNYYLINLQSLVNKNFNKLDLLITINNIYGGNLIDDFDEFIKKYTIYYEIDKDEFIGGIYSYELSNKATKVKLFKISNSHIIYKSGYIYNLNENFIQKLLKL